MPGNPVENQFHAAQVEHLAVFNFEVGGKAEVRELRGLRRPEPFIDQKARDMVVFPQSPLDDLGMVRKGGRALAGDDPEIGQHRLDAGGAGQVVGVGMSDHEEIRSDSEGFQLLQQAGDRRRDTGLHQGRLLLPPNNIYCEIPVSETVHSGSDLPRAEMIHVEL